MSWGWHLLFYERAFWWLAEDAQMIGDGHVQRR
jgi:hypothetical protein